jgi:formylglycine-generating enzyme required for sulfatase activity
VRFALPFCVALFACSPLAACARAAQSASTRVRDTVAIPAGTFLMGSAPGVGDPQEHPRHGVSVRAFRLDRALVTVSDYGACVRAGACSPAGTEQRGTPGAGADQDAFCNAERADRASHPINCVDFEQASAYCRWVGERLPTEEEWEWAARGPDDRTYPWGVEAPSAQLCWNRLSGEDYAHALGTCPVGAYPAGDSAQGVHDLVGNVWEWTSSVWTRAYGGPLDASARVVRGGGWRDARAAEFRGANRNGSNLPDRVVNLGFRCAE